ncbi:MAG: hypothetical protein GY774_04860 [Planctomycetes bacterium]|nr:hypothetical protein [Planctomycetota bacterium]
MSACPNCGGELIGDGYNSVIHCENVKEDAYWFVEPDADPVYCDETNQR